MKTLTPRRQHLKIAGIVLTLTVGICGLAMASSEGGGGHNHWLQIDT